MEEFLKSMMKTFQERNTMKNKKEKVYVGKRYVGKRYVHHMIVKNHYYRVALCELFSKKIGDLIIINKQKWTITEISEGPIIDEQTFTKVLKYNDKYFFTEARKITKIISNVKIQDEKLFHEKFEYDNHFMLDTWVKVNKKSHVYIGILSYKKFEKIIQVKVQTPLKDFKIRDRWNFAALLINVEDTITELNLINVEDTITELNGQT